MVKVIGPALSLGASKSLGKSLTYQKRPSGSSVYLYKKPGGFSPNIVTWKQRDQRTIRGLIIARWQAFTTAEKAQWDTDAKSVGFVGAGYHYFHNKAQTNLEYYLGLVAFYGFNRDKAGSVPDLSGNGFHGSLLPTWPSNSPQYQDGQNDRFGKCLFFDGDDDYVNIGNQYSKIYGKNTLTVEAWIKLSANLTGTKIAIGRTGGEDTDNYFLSLNWAEKLDFELKTTTGWQLTGATTAAVTIGQWTHIAGVYNGSKIKAYINGIKSIEDNATGLIVDDNQNQYIGGQGSFNFEGYIDNVGIYNRALSDLEIKIHSELFRRA